MTAGREYQVDIAAALLFGLGVCGAVAAKIAARKGRFWPAWGMLGAVLGPIALLLVVAAPRLEPCPKCGRMIVSCPGRRCSCGYAVPIPTTEADVAKRTRADLGSRIGDKLSRVDRRLARRGVVPIVDGDERRFTAPAFGHDAEVLLRGDDRGRVCAITLTFERDEKLAIWYELRSSFVTTYGRPDPTDDGSSLSWTAGKVTISLSSSGEGELLRTTASFRAVVV